MGEVSNREHSKRYSFSTKCEDVIKDSFMGVDVLVEIEEKEEIEVELQPVKKQ